jgi:two-component system sensor histidine kinase MprB
VRLRTRFLLVLVLLAAGGSIAFGISSYLGSAARMRSEIDRSLDDAADHEVDELRANAIDQAGPGDTTSVHNDDAGAGESRPRDFDQILVQWIDSGGTVVWKSSAYAMPVSALDRQAAAGSTKTERYATIRLDGESYRVLTVPGGDASGAVQAGRSLAETDRLLEALRDRTLVIMLIVTAAAGLIGWLLAHQITRRIEALTIAAEGVAKTGRLDVAVVSTGRDETARLAGAFNEMLAKLEDSRNAQQRLVQDASHELRTPLTSIRANVSVVRQFDRLDATQRQGVLDDLESESRELTALVDELIELAVDRRDEEADDDVSLGELAKRVVERARRRTGRPIAAETDDTVRRVRSQGIERALHNLIDNAVKFSPDGSAIEVRQYGGTIEVRDHGPGFAPGDLDRVFDRFYRAVEMRSRPGSGLGLAIVRDIAESHHGTATARNHPDGGAVVAITIP